MPIFLCDGECFQCSVSSDCPLREKIEQEFYRKEYLQVMEELEKELEKKVNPQLLIELTKFSLFSFIQKVDLLEQKISIEEIQKQIISGFSPLIQRGIMHPHLTVDYKMVETLKILATKIKEVLDNSCEKKCFSCFLKEHCFRAFDQSWVEDKLN